MRTEGVSSAILSGLRNGVAGPLATIAKWPFDGTSFQVAEKVFFETAGKSGARGLRELLFRNDEAKTTIVHNGQKHYRKYLATGRYLTLLG